MCLYPFVSESGWAIACEGRDVELACPSGHVIKIDGGSYGRETPHYCRRPLSLSATSFTLSTPEQCASVDVIDILAGRQSRLKNKSLTSNHMYWIEWVSIILFFFCGK